MKTAPPPPLAHANKPLGHNFSWEYAGSFNGTETTTHYTYDNKKQLIASENSSVKYTYSYDSRGNIISKKKYDISIDENNEKVYTEKENDSYTYDETWKDKLTSYNGQTISYDVSGNPLNYMGHNLSWTMGRQLGSFDDIIVVSFSNPLFQFRVELKLKIQKT